MDRTHELIQMRIRQPYFDWANSEDDDGTRAILQEVRTDPSIYLVETIDSLEDFDLLIDDTWERIFREQPNGWMRDANLWPEGLTREMFLEWFDCEVPTNDLGYAQVKNQTRVLTWNQKN